MLCSLLYHILSYIKVDTIIKMIRCQTGAKKQGSIPIFRAYISILNISRVSLKYIQRAQGDIPLRISKLEIHTFFASDHIPLAHLTTVENFFFPRPTLLLPDTRPDFLNTGPKGSLREIPFSQGFPARPSIFRPSCDKNRVWRHLKWQPTWKSECIWGYFIPMSVVVLEREEC